MSRYQLDPDTVMLHKVLDDMGSEEERIWRLIEVENNKDNPDQERLRELEHILHMIDADCTLAYDAFG